jgi:simple sugar transport system ATP-binding protein
MSTDTSTVPLVPGLSAEDLMLECRHLTKRFGSVTALRDASIALPRGEVTAIIGDNGAGKSTLVRCLVGVHSADSGEYLLDGRPAHFADPESARRDGIETVHQNLALVNDLTVWQNLFLNREITRGVGPVRVLDRRAMKAGAAEIVSQLAINMPPIAARVHRLSGGQRQAVALSRAANWGSKLVVLDEPTAALGVQETAKVEQLIHDLRERGITVLIISHNFEQVLRVAQGVWVMRAGRSVAYRRAADTDGQELVGLVTGAIEAPHPTHHNESETP